MSWAFWKLTLREIATGVIAGLIVLLLQGAAFPTRDATVSFEAKDLAKQDIATKVAPESSSTDRSSEAPLPPWCRSLCCVDPIWRGTR